MKRITIVFACSLILGAFIVLPQAVSMQRGRGRGAPGPPQNLQVLPEGTNVQMVMQGVAAALGVQCTFCHVQGDFPNDEMVTKQTARRMMQMVQTINSELLADLPTREAGEAAVEVTCMTCHRGSSTPMVE
jgi:hypothetical protein